MKRGGVTVGSFDSFSYFSFYITMVYLFKSFLKHRPRGPYRQIIMESIDFQLTGLWFLERGYWCFFGWLFD